jgi:hypothetical protein
MQIRQDSTKIYISVSTNVPGRVVGYGVTDQEFYRGQLKTGSWTESILKTGLVAGTYWFFLYDANDNPFESGQITLGCSSGFTHYTTGCALLQHYAIGGKITQTSALQAEIDYFNGLITLIETNFVKRCFTNYYGVGDVSIICPSCSATPPPTTPIVPILIVGVVLVAGIAAYLLTKK